MTARRSISGLIALTLSAMFGTATLAQAQGTTAAPAQQAATHTKTTTKHHRRAHHKASHRTKSGASASTADSTNASAKH